MDQATKLSVVVLGLFVVSVIWWCVRSGQREQQREKAKAWAKAQVTPPMVPVQRNGKHHLTEGVAVTVPVLLQRAATSGDPLRLNWPQEDLDEQGRVRPYVQDEFPTGVLPRVEGAAKSPDN